MAVLLRLARVQIDALGMEAGALLLERALHLAAAGPERSQALNLLAEIQFNRLMPEASARTAEQALALARALGGQVRGARWIAGLMPGRPVSSRSRFHRR